MSNVADLAKRAADALEVQPRAVKAVVEQFLEELKADLVAGETVYLQGLGSFVHSSQKCNDDYYRERGIDPGEGGELRVKICRFKMVRRLRQQVNGIEAVGPVDRDRVNYKERASGVLEVNGETESERRARARITLGDIAERLNSEVM